MKKTEAESKLEYLETSEEARAAGLRRIKRRHFAKTDEVTLKDCKVTLEIVLDADVLSYFKEESGEEGYKAEISAILRKKMEESLELKRLRRELLEDKEFLPELKEKLAA